MKLTIEVEGTEEELGVLVGYMSDGGGEDGWSSSLEMHLSGDSYHYITLDYSKCFPAWGYDPEVDGNDLLITGKVASAAW